MSDTKLKILVLVYMIVLFQTGYWSGYLVGRG